MKQNLLFNQASALGKRLAMVLTMLLLVGIGQAWGATAEFLPSHFSGQGTTSTGSAISATINGVTFKCDKGYGTTQIRCYSGSTIKISSSNTITAISFTFSDNKEGGLSASYTDLSTNSWETDLSSQARITKCVVTYEEASADPCTVTLVPGSGSVTDTELEEPNAGEGVTLPTPTLDCGDWEFAGWKTTSAVTTETTTKPTLIPAGTYKPASNITLYAVYKRTEEGEGGGGGDVTESVDFSTKSYSDGQEVSSYEGTNFSVTFDKGTNSNAPKYYNSGTAIRVYAGGYFIVSSEATITKIVLTFGSSDKTNTITTNIDTYSNGTWTGSATSVQFTIGGTKDHRRIQAIEVTTSGGGSSSSTYYHSTPECSTETLVSLDPNGGTGGTPSVTATKGEAMPTLITLPTRTGYTFQGYFTAASGGTQYYNADGTSAKDWDKTDETFTLYAQWECDIPEFTLTSTTFARTEGQEIRIASNATNVPANAKFTWYLNGAEVANQSSSELYIASCTIADAGNYTCTISYDDCSFNSTNYYSVKIYSVRGLKEDWNTLHPFTSTSETEGEFSIYLDANTSFKVWDGEYYYGNPESDTMSGTSENWTMQQNKGGDVTMSNVIAGTYTFKLDYSDAANTKISVYYPEKKIVYFNPGDWSNSKYAVYSWEGEDNSTVLMTKVDDCTDRNIYQAEIDASHNNVIFIGGNASYDVSDPWNNVEHKTIDLTYPSDDKVLFDRTQANTTHLFLTPNNNWKQDNPRYAAYFFGNGEIWSSLSYNDKENMYYCKKISGYPSVISCRMNPSTTENNWDNKWNQSSDLSIPTDGTNHYTVKDNTWDKGDGTWSTVNGDWTAFTPNYTVTFDANGHGTAPDAQCVAKNGKATTPAAPTATGYTFGGWYKEAGCTNAWDFANDVVTSDITLYAQWTANTNTAYTVKHYQENIDGTYPATPTDTDNLTGTTATSVTPDVKDYTGFTAPSTQTVTIAADGSTVVEYKYTRNSYTLTWNLAGGKITDAGTTAGSVKFGAPLTAPTVTKSGLTFSGWSPEVPPTMPAEDVTYTAIWENCIWVETTTIEDGDEIVFIMVDNTTSTSYAMNNEVTPSSNPLAIEINTDIFSSGDVPNNIIWDIQKDANGIVFYSKTAAESYLRCNAKPNVRVGVGANNTFTLDNGYIQSLSYDDSYLAVATGATIKDWRQYGYSSGNITNQTLKFYKRVCLPEGQYWVKWMVNGQEYTEGDPTTKVVAGGQVVKLPTIPDNYQLPGCTSKKFIGWTTDEILAETDDAPTMFTDAASSPAINTNQTFHALFADVLSEPSETIILNESLSNGVPSTWTSSTATKENGGVKLSSGSTGGTMKTPALTTLSSTATLTFKILRYKDSEDGKVSLSASTGTFSPASFTASKDVSTWTEVSSTLTGGNATTTITFTGTKEKRIYIKDILLKAVTEAEYENYVTQCCTPWEAPTLSATTSIAVGGSTTITHSGTTHGAVTYTSSNTYIATVDANNGKVTGVKPGKVTITATWDGVDGVNNYCPAETTIDITVRGSFTITYDANDALATGNTESTVIEYPDGKGTVANNGFALDGHEFVKWNTATDGSGYDYTEGASITLTDNLTLYAIWQPNQYDITVNVVGGSVKLGSTTITTANTPQTITDVVAHGQSFSFTNATPDAAYETPYAVTLVSGTATVTSNSLTISNVQSDLVITIEYTLKPIYTITYNIPEGGGELAADAVTSIYKGGSITLPGIKDGTISSEYSCEEFIGWTTNPADYEAAGLKPEPFYNAGASFSDVSEDVTFYPVYSRPGAGVGGTVTLTEEEMYGWSDASYGTKRYLTTCVGTWTTTGYKNSSHAIQLKSDGSPYVKFPDLSGNITQVVVNATNGSDATLTSGTFTLKTEGGTTIASASVNGSGICTIPVTGSYTTAYLYSSVTARITNIAITYGPPAIISTTLDCSSDVDECTITYDLNESFLAAGTQILGSCHNSTFKFSEVGTYTICSEPQANEYKLIGWNNQCDGKGSLTYTPGQEITSLPQNIITLYAQWAPEVIVHDSYEETKVYPTAMGGSITLNSGQYACDPKKYDFIGWTTDNPQLWQQQNISPMLLEENQDGTVTFTPTEPSQVYAVYAIEDMANSDAFRLSLVVNGNTYYLGYASSRIKATTIDNAFVLYKEIINAESSQYKMYYEDSNGDKQYVYCNSVGNVGTSTNPNEDWGWTIAQSGTGYTFTSINYTESKNMLKMNDKNVSMASSGSVFNMETVAEYKYVAKTNCSETVTITFVPGNGTMTPSTNPVTAKTGDVITLPTCEYEGWTFLGWVTENIEITEFEIDPSRLYNGHYEVGNSDITLYAYYTQIPESAEFDGTTSEVYKMYCEVNDKYYYAISHGSSSPGTLPSSNICLNAEEWVFTNTGEANVYYIQDHNNLYLTPEVNNTQLFFTSTPFPWKVVEIGTTNTYRIYAYNTRNDDYSRLIMFMSGAFYHSAKINEGNSAWHHVTIGGCQNPVYTTDPQPSKIISLVGSPMITSTIGQTVKASQKLQLVIKDMDANAEVTIAADGLTFYDTDNNVVNNLQTGSNGSLAATFTVAYTPTVADNQIVNPTITVTCGSTVRTFYNVSCRSLPADFAIVAKVGNMWYALPSQGLNSTDALVGYPVEVDNQNDPTAVTAVPENADWSLRQVYASSGSNDRFKLNGANIMFENNASPAKMLNASVSDNYLLTNAEYDNYKQSDNQGLYEWTPTTTDLETYTLTNAGRTDKKLNVSVNTVFGVHAQNVATNNLRFLPINDRYTPLALQVVEWKENSIVVMYNGDPEQTASVSVNGGAAQTTTLSAAQRDIAVYELTANGLAANPTQRLSIIIGAEKLLLPIPYIVNSNTTDAALTGNNKTLAAVSDLVVLNGKTFTADAATASKYIFRNVTIYGGGKLVIPADKGIGVNTLTMRLGTVNDDGSYTNSYPQLVLNGTINTGNINVDYLTTYDRYYALSLPYEVNTTSILYPADIYGDNLKDGGNNASFALQYYDGAARALNGKGWQDLDEPADLVAYKGYTFWGAPRKVKVNGATEGTRQKYGIHRIPITKTASDLMKGEKSLDDNGNVVTRTIDINAYPAESTYDMGWNFIGNPFLAAYGKMQDEDAPLELGMLVMGESGWERQGTIRYITTTEDGKYYIQTPVTDVTLYPFNTFFVQAAQEGAISFNVSNRLSLPARQLIAEQQAAKEITTGIILTGNDQTDRTGLLIADNFTEEYDFNADLSKFENSGINLYTIGKDGKLAFMAINQALAEQPIPLGYGAPADGEYTIAFDEDRYNATDISALYLIDYDRNETTNLLHTDYSFVTAAGTNNERFALQVAFIPQNATSVEWVDDATIQVAVDGNSLLLNNLPTDAGVQVFDALGRVIYATPNAPTEMQITLPTGYYLVRIADKQHAVVINTIIP